MTPPFSTVLATTTGRNVGSSKRAFGLARQMSEEFPGPRRVVLDKNNLRYPLRRA